MLLRLVVPLGFMLAATSALEHKCNPKACNKDMMNEKNICGSDGLSYPNRCHFEKVRCADRNMTIVKRGPCLKQKSCRDWEVYKRSNPNYKFQPNCKPDGSYSSVQCHQTSGFCWCVTPQGIPLPSTTVRWRPGTRQHCGRKKSTRRRSPIRKGTRNRACRQLDKAKFNNNLMNIFHTEWSRDHSGVVKPHNNESDLFVNQWKFHTMDSNADGLLDKTEYRDLKRVAKKAVKPKRCAKSFPRSCDLNSDQLISLQEWAECLTRDGMDDVGSEGGGKSTAEDSGDNEEDYGETLPAHSTSPHAMLFPVLNGQYEDDSSDIRDDDSVDCLTDRKTALTDGSQMYVPECTPDGRYKKVQCYASAGYCFCVHEDTGKNIPGTSVKNGTPQCDHLGNVNRPMKGCPGDKKIAFLKDLINFLHSRLMSDNVNRSKALDEMLWIPSKEERVATWTFVVFDKNKNKMLDRNEWKAFREMVSGVGSLTKCGRKLPRYCDINKDRHISMTEWLSCLNVQQVVTANIPNASSRAGKKNPLSMLMED